MDTHKIIARLGGTRKVAVLCEVTPGAVSQWISNGIPQARMMFLKAVRPEIFDDLTSISAPKETP